jgi:mono/diheme cytochrome c family protein
LQASPSHDGQTPHRSFQSITPTNAIICTERRSARLAPSMKRHVSMKTNLIVLLVLTVVLLGCSRDRIEEAATAGDIATVPTSTEIGGPAETGTAFPADTAAPGAGSPGQTGALVSAQAIYAEKCSSCHGPDGRRETGGVTLVSSQTQGRSDAELARIIREGSGRVSATAHARLGLDEAQVHAVVAHIRTLN